MDPNKPFSLLPTHHTFIHGLCVWGRLCWKFQRDGGGPALEQATIQARSRQNPSFKALRCHGHLLKLRRHYLVSTQSSHLVKFEELSWLGCNSDGGRRWHESAWTLGWLLMPKYVPSILFHVSCLQGLWEFLLRVLGNLAQPCSHLKAMPLPSKVHPQVLTQCKESEDDHPWETRAVLVDPRPGMFHSGDWGLQMAQRYPKYKVPATDTWLKQFLFWNVS